MGLVRRPAVAAVVAFALALPIFGVLGADSGKHYAVSGKEAIGVAREDPQVSKALTREGYTGARVSSFDDQQQRVSFFNGSRLVVNVLVGPDAHVSQVAIGPPTSGSRTANSPALLVGLALLFVLVTASLPLLTLRNLDVIAFAGFVLPIWLLDRGFLDASVLTAYPLLAYLGARCIWLGLAGPREDRRTSLWSALAARWSPGERERVLKLTLAGLAVLMTVVSVSSSGSSDVAFANLAGATNLLHGTVPYGHIPGFIVHGDTYPLLSYILYLPVAALMPVTDGFSDPQGALILTSVACLAAAAGLYRLVGPRAAIGWLAFPPVLLATSSGSNDVLLAACLVAVFICLQHRRLSAFLLGVAAWIKLTPIVALPIWLARLSRRGALDVGVWLGALSLALLGSLVALGGLGSLGEMAHALKFQFDRASLLTLWSGRGVDPMQVVAQAALVGAVVAAALAVGRDRLIRDDLPRLAALLAGVLLLVQLSANYWTWAYLPWVIAPALLVLVPGPATRESRVAEPATFTRRGTRGAAIP